MSRWRVLVEKSPSGKTLFECQICGRVSPTPDKQCMSKLPDNRYFAECQEAEEKGAYGAKLVTEDGWLIVKRPVPEWGWAILWTAAIETVGRPGRGPHYLPGLYVEEGGDVHFERYFDGQPIAHVIRALEALKGMCAVETNAAKA